MQLDERPSDAVIDAYLARDDPDDVEHGRRLGLLYCALEAMRDMTWIQLDEHSYEVAIPGAVVLHLSAEKSWFGVVMERPGLVQVIYVG